MTLLDEYPLNAHRYTQSYTRGLLSPVDLRPGRLVFSQLVYARKTWKRRQRQDLENKTPIVKKRKKIVKFTLRYIYIYLDDAWGEKVNRKRSETAPRRDGKSEFGLKGRERNGRK